MIVICMILNVFLVDMDILKSKTFRLWMC